MGSLFAALQSAGDSLNILERAIGTTQNNVTNANTPGYVTQTFQFSARPFDPQSNLWGGVESSGTQDARDVYAEQAVWSANQQAGFATQQSTSVGNLQSQFDVSGQNGIPGALSSLYSAFSAWSTTPSDTLARQQVLTAAGNLADSFNQASSSVAQLRTQADQQLTSTVTQINQYATQIASINAQIQSGHGSDAGIQSQLYNTLEQLSNLAPISVLQASDGTSTVLLGGQAPLVLGKDAKPISVGYSQSPSAPNPTAAPTAQILSEYGQDISHLVTSGKLGGLVDFRNNAVPSVIGDGQNQGSLNQLAQGVADRVNTLLASGQSSAGPPPVAGIPLFTYSGGSATGVAATLAVNPAITGSQLAAASTGTNGTANGVASALAQLSSPLSSADKINGLGFTDFYSNFVSQLGEQASTASAAQQTQSGILAQAQNLRAQVSGVSLNAQATQLLQFQNAYEASAQVISVINNMTQSLLTTFQNTL